MKSSLITGLLLVNIINAVLAFGIPTLVLRLKNENRSITVQGDQCSGGAVFDNLQVSCACMTGLWAFYERDCESARAIIGASSGQCVDINFTVRKVSLISPLEETSSSAVVLDNSTSSIGGKFITAEGIPSTPYFVPSGFPTVITTGTRSWRIPQKKICMKPYSLDSAVTNYCLFKHATFQEYRIIDEECSNEDEIVSPNNCMPYLQDEDVEENTCMEVDAIPKRTRREAVSAPGKFKRGAGIFLDPIPTEDANETATTITNADENHGLNVTIDRPLMNSEIWNFMTFRAQVRLGIRESKVDTKGSIAYSPAFEFLEIAKQIQQKACPNHYVTDEHYDIAVGAFMSLQKNHLGFMDSFLDFSTSERIMDSLNACLNNITTYPFIERLGGITNVSCNGSNPIVHGAFEKFGDIIDLSITQDQSSRSNEPIVETVWKVFVHAHSACFPFFKASFNDHHRFATVMLPLFTNEVNDMWFSVTEVKADIYTGFLGDAVELMDSVAYCAAYSRLESTYPWDLPRPKKDNARRKRQVSEESSDFECMEDYDARNVCSTPEDDLPPAPEVLDEANESESIFTGSSFMTIYS